MSLTPVRRSSPIPHSRQGFEPVLQGRITMEKANKPTPSYVGVDVSKHRLDVYLRAADMKLTFADDTRGITLCLSILSGFRLL